MNPPQPHLNRHGVSGLRTDRFSEQEIQQFNAEFDRRNGWSQDLSTIFVNASRRPESTYVPASKCWEGRT